MTRWQIIRLLLIVVYRVLVKRDYLGLLRDLLPKEEPPASSVQPVKNHPSAMGFSPELRKMVRGGGPALLVVLLLSGIAMATGQIGVMGYPPTPVYLKGGDGIAITPSGTITATGIPAGGVSDTTFNAYTTAGGGRATNDRVDTVQEQVTAQAVGSALGATAVQPEQFDNFSTAQGIKDAAQDAAFANHTSSLGSAAFANVTSFATAAEGDLAGTALQPTSPGIVKDIKAYGAKCDVKVDPDGASIASGSTELTLANQICYSTDVGKSVVVLNAGAGGGANLVSTVASCQTAGASHVYNLSSAAGTTVTGKRAIVAVDDAPVINALLAEYECTNSACDPVTFRFAGATYLGSSLLPIGNNMTFQGPGTIYFDDIRAIHAKVTSWALGQFVTGDPDAEDLSYLRKGMSFRKLTFQGLQTRYVEGATTPTYSTAVALDVHSDASGITYAAENSVVTECDFIDVKYGVDTIGYSPHLWVSDNFAASADIPESVAINYRNGNDGWIKDNYTSGYVTGIYYTNGGIEVTGNHTSSGLDHDNECEPDPANNNWPKATSIYDDGDPANGNPPTPDSKYGRCGSGKGSPSLYGIVGPAQQVKNNYPDCAKIAPVKATGSAGTMIQNNFFINWIWKTSPILIAPSGTNVTVTNSEIAHNYFYSWNTNQSTTPAIAYASNVNTGATNHTSKFMVNSNNYGFFVPDIREGSFAAFSDNAANLASSSAKGFLKKLPNDATLYMDGSGNWSTPPSSGGSVTGVSSADTDISVSESAPAPVLTLNSSTSGGANKIVKLDGAGNTGLGVTPTDARLTIRPADPVQITGTVTTTTNAFLVSGSGTSFTTEVKAGDTIKIGAQSARRVVRVIDDTTLEIGVIVPAVSGQTATVERNTIVSQNSNGDAITYFGATGIFIDGTVAPTGEEAIFITGSAAGMIPRFELVGYNSPPAIAGRNSGGTPSVPTATPSGQQLLVLAGYGYEGNDWEAGAKALIRLMSGELWSTTANGTYIDFHTTANGGTSRTEKMRITGDGNVGIATASPNAKLSVSGGISGQMYSANKAADATLTAEEVGNSIISNLGATALVTATLPAAAAGYSFIATVSAAYELRLDPGASDTIYLDDEALTAEDGEYISLGSTIGTQVACYTAITGAGPAYDWFCRTIRGTVTEQD